MAAVTQKSALEYAPTQLYIGGQWRDAGDGATFAVTDPATGKTLVEVADPDEFFTNPQSDRAKDFLGKILGH